MLFGLLSRWRTAQRRRKDIRELQALPDMMLWDLGISRFEIPDYVDGRLVREIRPPAQILQFPVTARCCPQCCCEDAA